MRTPRPELLVDSAWLEAQLDADAAVRVFDCTLARQAQPSGASIWLDGRPQWQDAHIPGAGYLHMVEDLSAPSGSVPYGLPSPTAVAHLLSSFGVEANATVVLYGSGGQSVVHRIWWVLTAAGIGDVRVLDGGFERWVSERRPVESGAPTFPKVERAPGRQLDILVDRDAVANAVGNPDICLIHSLSAEQFCGTGGQVYRRPGRIPGSVNIPAASLIDSETKCIRPLNELNAIFAATGADRAKTIIPYCGGGIAATTIFLGLARAGYDNVRLYDGSLLDWTADPTLPMISDADASLNSAS